METESVRISKDVMKRVRTYVVSNEDDGRIYGKISDTIEKAIEEYLDRKELCRQTDRKNFDDKTTILETELIKLRSAIDKYLQINNQIYDQ